MRIQERAYDTRIATIQISGYLYFRYIKRATGSQSTSANAWHATEHRLVVANVSLGIVCTLGVKHVTRLATVAPSSLHTHMELFC